jgi:hypothetical protein
MTSSRRHACIDLATAGKVRAAAGRAASRRAATALELVCILPVLMAIVLGAVDMGRFAQYENILSNAARVGAHYGATHRLTPQGAAHWESELMTAVEEEAAHLSGFDAALLEVEIDNFNQADGSRRVEVEAAYPFKTVVNWPGLPSQIDLRRRVAFQEYR